MKHPVLFALLVVPLKILAVLHYIYAYPTMWINDAYDWLKCKQEEFEED